MAVVYLAEDVRLGRKVALKLVSPDLAEDDRFRDRFVRESRLAAALEHPHIVPIYAAGEADGTLFIAMRYIDGTDLGTFLAEHGPLEPHTAVEIGSQVAEALDAAHEHGLVHRDVKPGNVMVERRGGRLHCYLTDFGLTKQVSSLSGLTGTGQLIGTIDYLSPEQIQGRPADGRSDQYSLACVLYESLTGTPPFARESEAATLWAHVQESRPRVSAARPDVPASMDKVIARGLARSPADRYPTCEVLLDAARHQVGDVPLATLGKARRPVIAVLATAALLAAVLTAVGLATRGAGDTPAAAPTSHLHLARLNPATGQIGKRIPIPGDAQGGQVWIDASNGRLWVADSAGLVRVDPTHGATKVTKIVGGGFGVTVANNSVWVSGGVGTVGIYQFNLNGQQLGFTPVRSTQSNSSAPLASTNDLIWESCYCGVWRIDAQAAENQRLIALATGTFRIVSGAGAVWVPTAAGTVARIDATTSKATPNAVTLPFGYLANDVGFGAGALWVAAQHGAPKKSLVFEVNPRTNKPIHTTRIGGTVQWLAGGPASLAVGYNPNCATSTCDPSNVAILNPSGSIVLTKHIPTAAAVADPAGLWLLLWDGK